MILSPSKMQEIWRQDPDRLSRILANALMDYGYGGLTAEEIKAEIARYIPWLFEGILD